MLPLPSLKQKLLLFSSVDFQKQSSSVLQSSMILVTGELVLTTYSSKQNRSAIL